MLKVLQTIITLITKGEGEKWEHTHLPQNQDLNKDSEDKFNWLYPNARNMGNKQEELEFLFSKHKVSLVWYS